MVTKLKVKRQKEKVQNGLVGNIVPFNFLTFTLLRQNAPLGRAGMNGEESPPKL